MRSSRYGKNSSSGSLTSQISLRMLHSLLIQSFGRIRWAMILGELNLTRAYWLPVLSLLDFGAYTFSWGQGSVNAGRLFLV